jgi:hypothetical protein
MRFSLKWALAAMAYVALAAAAISAKSPLLADLLWAMTILALCYAMILAWIVRRERRAMAAGFVVALAANLICLYLAPSHALSSHALSAFGYTVNESGQFLEPAPSVNNVPTLGMYEKSKPIKYAADAMCTMAAGLFGCGLGALAFRRGEREGE